RDNVIDGVWPAAAAAGPPSALHRGAGLVAAAGAALTAEPHTVAGPDPHGWAAEVDALLAERAAAPASSAVALPTQLSVSSLVELGRDRQAAVSRLHRRLPARPDAHALLGNAFHDWVQRFYGAERLFDLDDLPGAVDGDVGRADAEELAELQSAFMASPWAARTPIDVEVPFEMVIGAHIVRGRIDAVFADADGGVTVVDWKTGAAPSGAHVRRQAAVQLGVYRLAWAALHGCPESAVRAAFHYVRNGHTVIPDELPGPDELVALLQPPACA
ncbi:MAG TPA: PD-(D/E)XK nuclease family protein, partial [Mycobacterium sp.]